MPQLKQPSSLEELALENVEKLVWQFGAKLLNKVCSGKISKVQTQRWGVPRPFFRTTATASIKHFKLDGMNQFLQPGLPVHLADSVSILALKAITKLIGSINCSTDSLAKTGDDACRKVTEDLILMVLHPYLSRLDLLQWPWFIAEVLLKKLHTLHFLKVLKLLPGGWSPVWTTVISTLESDNCNLTKLVAFSMRCHCTDRIIEVVSHSAGESLRHLDVMSSMEITDASVEALLRVNNLVVLNLSSTSISADGYIRLLFGLPFLQKFLWYDPNCLALRNFGNSVSLPKLRTYDASKVSTNQLKILVSICPNLTQIIFHWVEADLSILKVLKHLREIRLAHCNANISNLNGLLQVTGEKLISLELHEVTDVDLFTIGFYCTNVRRMSLICNFINNQNSLHIDLRFIIPPFHALENLIFCSHYFEHLFFNCINVRKLEISCCHNLNDNLVATVLSRNPLKKLEILSIDHCGYLSVATVHLLLTCCERLRLLEGLYSWGGVTLEQIEELKHDSKKRNLDIEFLWKKPLDINW